METQAGRLSEIAQSDNAEFLRVIIPLKVVLTNIGNDIDSYKVPTGYKLAISEIRGHLATLDLDSEDGVNIGAIVNNLSLQDRILAKAMNCRIKLQNQDTNDNIVEDTNRFSDGMSLATILPLVGGEPIRFAPPLEHTIPSGHTVKMTASIVSNATGLDVAPVEYGVTIVGTLVKV